MKKKKVLLIGPKVGSNESYYGGGIGGYTRNMSLYLQDFQFSNISLIPFYSTSRKKGKINVFSFPVRFVKDVFGLMLRIGFSKVGAIHILGQYRIALPREVAWVLLAKIFGLPVVYEIKAGMFIIMANKSKWHKMLSNYILQKSDLILVEGKIYLDYVLGQCGKNAIYFPNVVSFFEIPKYRKVVIENPIKILFVGFCYEGKGIFDIVNAIQSNRLEMEIVLEIIGAESSKFSDWINKVPRNPKVKIIRHGPQSHGFVLERMKKNTIYLYPSRHSGEGHNNTINEALMNSMIIISSKAGFLGDILSDCGYLIDTDNNVVENIVDAIKDIVNNPNLTIKRTQAGRRKIETIYNSRVQGDVLETEYIKILDL